jgi:2'-5' RNA ligase
MKEERGVFDKRLFIAVDIPESVKNDIYSFAADLFERDKGIRMVPASNIHVTLKFLGNININKIEKIENAVKITADSFSKFRYRITGSVNAFPNLKSARVVFMEIGEGGNRISEIYDLLENNLTKIKIRKEGRKFSPHITIARIRDKKNIEKLAGSHPEGPSGWMDCHEITLFESQLKPYGAEYSIVGRFSLK